MASVNTLSADGLTLEPLQVRHADEMLELLADPAIYEFENSPPPSLEWLQERYRKLQSRRSPDGAEHWLNWIIRLPDGRAAGYVQASARDDGHSYIAYVLGSAWWGQGLARRATEAMIAELAAEYGIHTIWAVFKTANYRSRRLLERLEFVQAPPDEWPRWGVGPDESLMTRKAATPGPAAL